jgi:hypothetical protein
MPLTLIFLSDNWLQESFDLRILVILKTWGQEGVIVNIYLMLVKVDKIVGKSAPEDFIERLEGLANSHHDQLVVDVIRAYFFGARFIVEVSMPTTFQNEWFWRGSLLNGSGEAVVVDASLLVQTSKVLKNVGVCADGGGYAF